MEKKQVEQDAFSLLSFILNGLLHLPKLRSILESNHISYLAVCNCTAESFFHLPFVFVIIIIISLPFLLDIFIYSSMFY